MRTARRTSPSRIESLSITITATAGEETAEKTVTIEVREDRLGPRASEVQATFIPWLQKNHPELGITDETEWDGAVVFPGMLIVSHYLFFSDEWEMGVMWHVMVPPNDWAEIYLRHRFTDIAPTYRFKISSLNAASEPYQLNPPESVWRG